MRTLVSYLNERTPQELRAIADKWEASQVDRLYAGNTFQLSQEMDSEFLQRRLLEKLSPSELETLLFFTRQPDYTADLPELVTATGVTRNEASILTSNLLQSGLLYADKIKITDPKQIAQAAIAKRTSWGGSRYGFKDETPKREVLVFPRELAKPFKRLLEEKLNENKPDLTVKLSHLPLNALLKRIEPELVESQAETWSLIGLLGTHDITEVADEMAKALSDEGQQKRVLEGLDLDSQHFFERLKEKGATTIPALLKDYVSLKRLGRSLRPLTERLLVWEVFEDGQSKVFMPGEIRQPQTTARPQTELALQTVTEPTQAVTIFPVYALAWDALTLLNYFGQNEVELTAQSYIPKRHVKKIMALLWQTQDENSEARFNFLIGVCQRMRLYVHEEDGRLLPGPEINEWLKSDFLAQTRQFFQNWRQNAHFMEPVYFPYYYGAQATKAAANDKMLGWLRECDAGVWYGFESLLNKVQREEPFFIKSRKELLNQFGLRQVEEMTRHWNQVEAEIIHKTFGTVFEWLGLIQVSRNPLNRVLAFSLTDFGAELVQRPGAPPQTLPTVPKPLLVQPNFEVLLLAPQVHTLWTLLKFSSQKKLDLVSIYALDRTTVLQGLELGFTTSVILEWLTDHNPQPLPQNIEVSVRDWGKGFKRVTVEQSVLLETDDPTVLDELLQSKKYAEYFVRRLSPTAAVVRLPVTNSSYRSDPLKTFRNLLKNGGFFAR